MKQLHCYFFSSLIILFFCFPNLFFKPVKAINRIEGQVYDQNRSPVSDVFVELLNEVDSLVARTRTNTSGRFSFLGVSAGHFTIKVLPLGKNLLEQSQDIEINNQLARSDTVFVDFYLRPDKRASDVVEETFPEAIFIQDVPQEARKLYKEGISDLEKNQDKGLSEIEEAIKIFPDYFDAFSRLGREYVTRKNYNKAYPYLLKAIDLNPRSYSSYYSLSYAFYQLKEIPAALEAAKACIFLKADSVNTQLLYGTLLRINENYQDSEKTLLKAKSLAKKPNAEIHWQLSLLFNKLKRNSEAADELETYLKILPNSPDKKKIQDLISKLRTAK